MMKLFELFVVSSIPVLKVLLITAIGSILATDYVNLLGEDERKYFNAVVFCVFNPSLIATNLSKTVTLDSIIKLWFMPLNILLTFIIGGSAFGWIVIQLTRAPSHLRGLILGCCVAGNLGNMLFIIIPAVCKEKGSPFGAPDVCYTFGMVYASLSMAIGAIYLWSYVYNIVRVYSGTRSNAVEVNDSIAGPEMSEENSKFFQDSRIESLLPSEVPSSIAYDVKWKKLPEFPAQEEEVLLLLERVNDAKRLSLQKMRETGNKRRRKGDGDDGDEEVDRLLNSKNRKSGKKSRR